MKLMACVEFTRKGRSGDVIDDFMCVTLQMDTPPQNINWCARCVARDTLFDRNLRMLKLTNITAWTDLEVTQ